MMGLGPVATPHPLASVPSASVPSASVPSASVHSPGQQTHWRLPSSSIYACAIRLREGCYGEIRGAVASVLDE